jgi:hypothetical protein
VQESRWERLYEMINNKFGIEKESVDEIEIKEGVKGKRETIIFFTPEDKMRLERLIEPKIKKVKFHYHRRTNRGTYKEIQYSPIEKIEIIKLYRWNQQKKEWEKIDFNKPYFT